MEEIMEQKMKEREMLTNNIVYDTDSFYDGHSSILTGPKKLKSEKHSISRYEIQTDRNHA